MAEQPPRLTAGMLVSALIRRTNAAGGFATVLHRGNAEAGAILVECAEHGVRSLVLERATGLDGRDGWQVTAVSAENADRDNERIRKRRQVDPDLWVIELDIADAQRLAAETIGRA